MESILKEAWPILKNPPVKMTLFQLKFGNQIDLNEFLVVDSQVRRHFPRRVDNIHTNIDLPSTITIGVSKISGTSNAKVTGYTYFTEDQKQKLVIEEDSLTFQNEDLYIGWDPFKAAIKCYLEIYAKVFQNKVVKRTSIRFINNFFFDQLENPAEYFKTMVSTVEDAGFMYPLARYGFRLTFEVPNTDQYAIVNQNLDIQGHDKFIYIFDIDVLDRCNLLYEEKGVLDKMDSLRKIKNNLFFNNVTPKLLELCN